MTFLAALLLAAQASQAPALEYLGHSCFVIITPNDKRILIDPYASGEWPGLEFPGAHADRVLITHDHWDHSGWRQVRGGPARVEEPGVDKERGYVITGIAGRHAEIGGAAIDYRNIIFTVETGGLRFCHLGDNGPLPEGSDLPERIGPVDVLLIPIDSEKRVLTYEEVDAWIAALSPRFVVPMHYRIPGLSHDHITGIGTVDEWLSRLTGKVRVERLGTDRWEIDPAAAEGVPGELTVILFRLPGQKDPDPDALRPGLAGAGRAKAAAREAAAEGDMTTALEQFDRAARLDPQDAEVLRDLGFLHLGGSRPDRAVEFLVRGARTAGTEDPATASLCWLGAGMALDLLERRPEALEAYGKVLELGINDDQQIDKARRFLESPYTED